MSLIESLHFETDRGVFPPARPPPKPAGSTGCTWTRTILPPELLLLLCLSDTIILSFWFYLTLLGDPSRDIWSIWSGELWTSSCDRSLNVKRIENKLKPALVWSGLNADGITAFGKSSFFSCTAKWVLSVANFSPLYLSFPFFINMTRFVNSVIWHLELRKDQ